MRNEIELTQGQIDQTSEKNGYLSFYNFLSYPSFPSFLMFGLKSHRLNVTSSGARPDDP